MRAAACAFAVTALVALLPAPGLAAIPAGNLVQNPGAETGPGSSDRTTISTPPGWTTTFGATAAAYGAPGFPSTAISSGIGGGANLFAGGPTSFSTAQQDIDVTGAAAEIGAGQVHAVFSAFLGGRAAETDAMFAVIQLLDANSQSLRSTSMSVSAADRNNQTALLLRSLSIDLPAQTATIRVLLQSQIGSGDTYNDAYADNVSVELASGKAPVFAQSVDAAPVSGTVLVKPPGARAFVPLSSLKSIPVGATIDTRKGRVRLTTSNGATSQSADFYQGVFQVLQRAADKGVAELKLVGGSFGRCPAVRRGTRAAAKAKSIRHLWGSGSGMFRTRGRFASASLRGTTWLTDDRCDGTLIRVTDGSVTVRDLPKKRTLVLNAPKQYLAKASRR